MLLLALQFFYFHIDISSGIKYSHQSATKNLPKEIQINHGLKEGKLVSIADAERGLKCNCTCTKCGKPLVAKKGEVNAHYFAHSADSDCTGETYEHIMAKMEIKGKKYLFVPDKRVRPVYQENERTKKLRKKAVNNGKYFPKQYWENNDGSIRINARIISHI